VFGQRREISSSELCSIYIVFTTCQVPPVVLGYLVMHIYFIGQKGISGISAEHSPELRTEALAREAAQNGHNVTVAVTSAYPNTGAEQVLGIKSVHFPSLNPTIAGGYVYSFLSCLGAIWIQADVIHVQGWRAGIFMRFILPFLRNTSSVWTISSMAESNPPLFRKVLPWIMKGFDTVCSSSRTIQYRLLAGYGIKTTYIPDGYSISPLPEVTPASVGLKRDQYSILLAENPITIRQIVRAYAASKSKKKLVVFGKGRTSSHITYINIAPMSRTTLSLIRQASLVIVADSRFSTLLLQAMDAGRKIIATTDSLHEEILGVSGKYYAQKDIKQLPQLIKETLRKNTLPGISTRAKNHFSWEKIGQEYDRAYKHSKAIVVPFDSIIPRKSFKIAG